MTMTLFTLLCQVIGVQTKEEAADRLRTTSRGTAMERPEPEDVIRALRYLVEIWPEGEVVDKEWKRCESFLVHYVGFAQRREQCCLRKGHHCACSYVGMQLLVTAE